MQEVVLSFGNERRKRGQRMSDNRTEKISVVIPIYNVEEYIHRCVDSVIHQTYENLEIILVDDGSPDNCGKICDEYASKDPRVRVIHKQNAGVGAARNDGIKAAIGEWITFIDSDDWVDPDYFKAVFDEMRDYDKLDVICDGGSFHEYGNRRVKMYSFNKRELYEGRMQMDMLMAHSLSGHNDKASNTYLELSGSMWGKFYRASFLADAKVSVDTNFHPFEDLIFNFRIFDCAKRTGVCTVIGYHYRCTNEKSVGHRFNPNMPKMAIDFMYQLTEYMQHRKPNMLIQQSINARGIRVFMLLFQSCYFHRENPDNYCTVAGKIKQLKRESVFKTAIHSHFNEMLTKKQVLLICLLRLPWVWPLKLTYCVKSKMQG